MEEVAEILRPLAESGDARFFSLVSDMTEFITMWDGEGRHETVRAAVSTDLGSIVETMAACGLRINALYLAGAWLCEMGTTDRLVIGITGDGPTKEHAVARALVTAVGALGAAG